jgi:hypothetical protein
VNEPEPRTEKPERPAPPPPTDARAEVSAIGKAYDALKVLDAPAQGRALRWLSDRLAADQRAATDDPWAREEPPF